MVVSRHGELIVYGPGAAPPVRLRDHPLLSGSPASAHRRRAEEHLEDVLAALDRASSEAAVHRSVEQGPVHQILIEAATGAELLVVGTRGAGGHHGLRLGPVNHAVLHYAPCPVAVVPDTR
ncbi:universal stress protein [Streptomyces sp. NPDC002785]|uniref:universal stress protein n=1 Tax=Streptomyces sp. NPDC002785 TaxID=3154543 RepID=UPI00332EB751